LLKKPKGKTIRYIRSRLISWGKKHFRNFPWRKTQNRYHALIAEILLQRTRAEQVLPVYRKFIKEFSSPVKLAAAKTPDIRRTIKSLGLTWRAMQLKKLGVFLMKLYGGKVPCNYEKLIGLPGVGPYAASAFLSFHCGKRYPIIDSNVVRLYGRLFGLEVGPETRRSKIMKDLANAMTPEGDFKAFNYALLDFTGKICKMKPDCIRSPLKWICRMKRKGC